MPGAVMRILSNNTYLINWYLHENFNKWNYRTVEENKSWV